MRFYLAFSLLGFLLALFVYSGKTVASDFFPGSRSVYVGNHNPKLYSSTGIFQLFLRACNCEQSEPKKALGNLRKANYCDCWSDARDEDQPAIQGWPNNISAHFNAFKAFFPGFNSGYDENRGNYYEIPTPLFLKNILKILGKESAFEFCGEAVPIDIDTYLKLLSKGKIPIGNITAEKEGESPLLLYHMYFHDIFNHFFLWVAFPDDLRGLIASKAHSLLDVLGKISKSEQNAMVDNFIYLLKWMAAGKFDTSMGSLNNRLFLATNPFPFSQAQAGTFKKLQKIALMELLERTLNFGLYNVSFKNRASTASDPIFFTSSWLSIVSRCVLSNFEKISKSKEIKDFFDPFGSIEKDRKALSALQHLARLPFEEIKKICEKIIESSFTITGLSKAETQNVILPDELMTAEEFSSSIKSSTEFLINKFENAKITSQNEAN